MIAVYYHQGRYGKGNKMCVMNVDSDDFQHILSKLDEKENGKVVNPWPTSDIVFIENETEVNRYNLEDDREDGG